MDRQTRNAIRAYTMFFILGCLVVVIEYSQVDITLQNYFLITRIFMLGLIIACTLFLVRVKKFNFTAHAFALFGFTIYPAVGEIFRPTYETLLMPVFIVLVLFSPLSKKLIYLSVTVSTLLFCAVYYMNYDRNLKLVVGMNVYDNMFTFVTFAVVAFLLVNTINTERELRNKAQSRFTLIGTQAAAILHDLKNVLSTPRLQIENLRALTDVHKNPEIDQAISDIEKTLNHASETMIKFNQMSVLANNEKSVVQIVDVLLEVKSILNRRLNGVDVEIQGDRSVMADQGFVTSLFLNLFMNSLQAMMKSENKNILITMNSKKISFQDNGPGFSTEALKYISKNLSYTDKQDGSGNGLRIIKEACFDLGAQVKFYNTEIGACVDIVI